MRHISGFAILQLYTDEYRAPWLCSQAPYECMPGCSLCGITIWELLRRHGRGEPVRPAETLGKVAVVLGLFFLKTCGASPLSAVRSGVKAAASQAHEQTRSRAA